MLSSNKTSRNARVELTRVIDGVHVYPRQMEHPKMKIHYWLRSSLVKKNDILKQLTDVPASTVPRTWKIFSPHQLSII